MVMDSRERTFLALNFEEPDRVPTDIWASRGFKEKLKRALGISMEEILDIYDVDLRYIEGPAYIGPPLPAFRDGSWVDIWGVRRKRVVVEVGDGVEVYDEVVNPPLAFVERVEDVELYSGWPSPDWFDYSTIEEQCERVREKGKVVVFMGDRLNRIAQLKPAIYLRGFEGILSDMVQNPELAAAIFSRIRDFYVRYLERILEAAKGKLDILLMGDDFGTQQGPIISPRMWEDFLGKGFSDFIEIAKSYGVRVMHHTCGSVRRIIPLMLDRGLEILQSIQPEASDMDPEGLKSEFGRRLAFHGGISVQRTLPFSTPEGVREEVKDRVKALAPGGGYILCTAHNIQADTPIENFLALLDAYKTYGIYPLRKWNA
jgi:uroporphyrinogen decarboxylase